MQYYLGLREVRSVLIKRGINLLSITPFLKLDAPELDFRELCQALERPEFIENKDIFLPQSLAQHNLRFARLFVRLLQKNIFYLMNKGKKLLS